VACARWLKRPRQQNLIKKFDALIDELRDESV